MTFHRGEELYLLCNSTAYELPAKQNKTKNSTAHELTQNLMAFLVQPPSVLLTSGANVPFSLILGIYSLLAYVNTVFIIHNIV